MIKINRFENNARVLNITNEDFKRIDMNIVQDNLWRSKNYLHQSFVSGDIYESQNKEIIYNPLSLLHNFSNHIMDTHNCSNKVKNISHMLLNVSIIKE